VRVPKKLAIFGFNLCASIFIGLCVYGLLIHSEGGKRPPGGILSSLLFAVVAVGCIAGIGYFGSQWDRRNAEEGGIAKHPPSSGPGKTGEPPDGITRRPPTSG
jgi:hypothetical protein